MFIEPTDTDIIFLGQLIKLGNQAEEILRTSVVQAAPVAENTFSNLYIFKDCLSLFQILSFCLCIILLCFRTPYNKGHLYVQQHTL